MSEGLLSDPEAADRPDRVPEAHSPGVVWDKGRLTRRERQATLGLRGAVAWFTGLPGAGKSTLAAAVEEHLVVNRGRIAYRLDGDNLRHGLCADLGFSAEDRSENIRRVGHVARVLADAGAIALVALVSPQAEARDAARAACDEWHIPFIEVWVATSLEVCEARDPKGLYARARAGELTGMTGVDDPYEEPTAADLVLPGTGPVPDLVSEVLRAIDKAIV